MWFTDLYYETNAYVSIMTIKMKNESNLKTPKGWSESELVPLGEDELLTIPEFLS
jgi:hypothetical protein